MIDTRAVASLAINGSTVPLVVDSGAFFSMLTDAAAAQMQLPVKRAPDWLRVEGLTGKVDARITTVDKLHLPSGEIPRAEFIVGGNEPGAGAMGLMGRNLLAFADTEYDLAHGMIRFMFPSDDCKGKNMAYWARSEPVSELSLEWSRSRWAEIAATVQLNGRSFRAVFDTGATSLVTLAAARKAGLSDADLTAIGISRGAGRGNAQTWTAKFREFDLAGEKIHDPRLLVADFDNPGMDMLLGIDFFLAHRIYVSREDDRMFFTYNGGPVFRLDVASAPVSTASAASATAAGSAASAPVDAASAASAASAPPSPAEPSDAAAPIDARGYARRGAAFASRGDFVRALADLDRACAMAPQAADSFTQRGIVHEALRQRAEALQDFDTALRLDAAQSDARMRRALLHAEKEHERDEALADLDALDSSLPMQAHMRLALASAYLKLHLPARALPQYDRWIAAHGNEEGLESALNDRCWVRAMLGVDLDKALSDCNAALDRQPKNAAFLDSRGWVRLRRGEFRDALSDYDRSLAIRADNAWSLYGRGIARTKLDDAAQGRADIEAARKLLPSIDASAGRYGITVDGAASAVAH